MIVGEDRKPSHMITMSVEHSVCVEWPEGIELDLDECKAIAANAVRQRWGRDVGPVGKIVWANCSSDCSDSDVTIEEVIEL